MRNELLVNETWSKAISAYSDWLKLQDLPKSTIKLRNYHLRHLAQTHKNPWETTPEELETYMLNPDWGNSTKRSRRSTLRNFYEFARIKGYVETSPAQDLPRIKTSTGTPRPAPEIIIQTARLEADHRVKLMLELAATLGLRCVEISKVHSKDVVNDLVGYSLIVHGKGSKTRTVPITDQTAATIKQAEGWLFPGNDNGHLSAAYISKLISRALPKNWTAHTLRHRFATKAYSAERDLLAVSQLLGHASVATTQIYVALVDDSKRRAVLAAAA